MLCAEVLSRDRSLCQGKSWLIINIQHFSFFLKPTISPAKQQISNVVVDGAQITINNILETQSANNLLTVGWNADFTVKTFYRK